MRRYTCVLLDRDGARFEGSTYIADDDATAQRLALEMRQRFRAAGHELWENDRPVRPSMLDRQASQVSG